MDMHRRRRRLTAVVLAALLIVESACFGSSLTPKQQIDRDDRTAFAALRAFQQTETAAFHAGAPWPTAAQHQQIGAKLSRAYTLVIDVAQAGIALKPGAPVAANIVAESTELATLVGDIVALATGAPSAAAQQARDAQAQTNALTAAVSGGGKP